MTKLLSFCLVWLLLGFGRVSAQDSVQLVDPNAPKTTPAVGALLPANFAGWEKTQAKQSKDPSRADDANAAVLKEYGFTDLEQATYTSENRRLEVRAARFQDATGAYGAFTFYKQPNMLIEKIGDQAASQNNLVVFYRGNILVKAQFDEMTAMSAAELRQLAEALPRITGSAANLPSLPSYLPRENYVKNSAKYVLGPVGLGLMNAPLGPDQVDFNRGAEVAYGKYKTDSGSADLMLISYPTPQIAIERTKALEARPAAAGLTQIVRRSGPIVVFATGDMSASDAQRLAGAINYDAKVTWNEPTFLGKRNNIGNLVVAALMLCGIVLLFALAAGVAFGGVRLLVKKLYPDRVFDRTADVEIIRLKLSEPQPK